MNAVILHVLRIVARLIAASSMVAQAHHVPVAATMAEVVVEHGPAQADADHDVIHLEQLRAAVL